MELAANWPRLNSRELYDLGSCDFRHYATKAFTHCNSHQSLLGKNKSTAGDVVELLKSTATKAVVALAVLLYPEWP
jgi:hypothetical protein